MAKLCPRNFNKRINRQKQINKELSSKIKLLSCAVSTLEKENVKLKKDLDIACIDKTKLSKSNSYLKTKINKVTENTTTNKNVAEPKLLELHDYIAFLENHEGVLEERVEELSSQKLSFFQNKKYTNKIRSVYEDLLCFGVSSRNVEKVVRIVLEKLAGITYDRLPKATFSKDMLYEARALAQFQVASELKCSDADFCLQSDGTSKKGHSYMTYDASKKSGEVFVLGLREVGSGDAQAQLDLLKEVVGDISDASSKSNFSDTFFASIKNLMSDRCYTQKKFNKLLIDYRNTVLPKVKSNWELLSESEKSKHLNVNEYFCGLHFIVALADTAEACLKLWEGVVFPDPKKVGSLNHGSYSNGESGPLRLIRSVCKLVQERGCEKSGRMVSFSTFMKETNQMDTLPLYPFLGNRFNILFLNGARVFYLYPFLVDFLNNLALDNKLMSAVYHDLQVLHFRVACQALGLIDKYVTGPLWRMMVKEKEVLNMSKHYQKMYTFFNDCFLDATPFLEGRNSLFPDLVREDDRLASLLCFDYGPNVKLMLKQCIELIFGGSVSISKKMLEDHLHGGKYASPDESLCKESVSVPTTNANPERDFGMLDRFMKLKPKALDIVYEGIIMFTANNTRNWRDSLPKEQFDIAMDFARESKKLQKEVYFKRKMMIHVTRAERLGKNMEERRRKEMNLVLEKERLAKEIEKVGGLWCSKEAAENYLKKLKTEKEKKSVLKIQLGFRQKVLGVDCDKSLFFVK